MPLDLRDFDFTLPEHLIAKYPIVPRDDSRLLHITRQSHTRTHRSFRALPTLLRKGDVLVLNKTRVLKARLKGRGDSGRLFEVLLLEPSDSDSRWNCLVRPGKHADPSTRIHFKGGWSGIVRRSPLDDRQFEIDFVGKTLSDTHAWLDQHGEVPLPPYLKRSAEPKDAQTYQTVFAEHPGSVAAPTAGLHFTPRLLDELRSQGVGIETLVLHIGYGTFGTIDPQATELHEERYEISEETFAVLEKTRRTGGRVIAVGTTVLRTLESAGEGKLCGKTRLFIRPGYRFSQIDGLVTNFHLPQSSLFMLVCAFLGTKTAQEAYAEAIERHYRFFSYGDAMAIL